MRMAPWLTVPAIGWSTGYLFASDPILAEVVATVLLATLAVLAVCVALVAAPFAIAYVRRRAEEE
jgi:hypothetical protein